MRLFEERLDRHSKKLSGISRSVSVEQGRYPGFIGSAQRLKLGFHNFAPGQLLVARCQSWHSIGCAILVVELVSEFMKNNVLAVGGIGRAMFDGCPGEHQRSHSTAGLTEATHSPFLPNMLTNLVVLLHHVCQWINKNRDQPGEIIRIATQ